MTTTATRTKKSTGAEIYGRYWEAKVDSCIKLDGKSYGERLLEGDDYTCPGWDGCDFRYPNPVPGWETSHAIACNVYVTGRTLRLIGGDCWVRVKVEWVGDCEPSTYCGGWMLCER